MDDEETIERVIDVVTGALRKLDEHNQRLFTGPGSEALIKERSNEQLGDALFNAATRIF